jgi:hypothetical protein
LWGKRLLNLDWWLSTLHRTVRRSRKGTKIPRINDVFLHLIKTVIRHWSKLCNKVLAKLHSNVPQRRSFSPSFSCLGTRLCPCEQSNSLINCRRSQSGSDMPADAGNARMLCPRHPFSSTTTQRLHGLKTTSSL